MNYSKLTISQMAKLNNISTQTLRYYDKIGLLKPYICGENNKYRYYRMPQCAVLDIITYMKSLNMSLEQIKKYLNTADHEAFTKDLIDRQGKIQKEISRLESVQNIINRKIQDNKKYSHLPADGIPYIELIPQRTIYKFDTKINYYYNDNSSESYEYMLRLFKKHLAEKNPYMEYFYNVGSIMKKNNFINKNFVSTELFIFLEDGHPFTESEIIESNTYLCMTCENSDHETNYINVLLDTIQKNGYQIIGDYICEVIDEFFSFKYNRRNMTLKLQIPIRFH